jgi:hypothetical protein
MEEEREEGLRGFISCGGGFRQQWVSGVTGRGLSRQMCHVDGWVTSLRGRRDERCLGTVCNRVNDLSFGGGLVECPVLMPRLCVVISLRACIPQSCRFHIAQRDHFLLYRQTTFLT